MAVDQTDSTRPRSVFAARDQPAEPSPPAPVHPSITSAEYWTEERRRAQSLKMRELMARGIMNGPVVHHGRKRAKKAQEIVAEHYQEQAEVIIHKIDGMLAQNRSKELQLAAIDRIFKAEEWATKNARDEEKHFKDMGEEQLEQYLIGMVGEALGFDLSGAQIIDSTAEDMGSYESEYDPMESQLGGDILREALERVEEADVVDQT